MVTIIIQDFNGFYKLIIHDVMKTGIIITTVSLFALFGTASGLSNKKNVKTESPGFAVVELFTSEGCSSCPPADALVSRIAKEYRGQQVFILAFHVDYWNRLGWKDPFSNADWSARQYQYSKFLHEPQVYTPQIVVNGRSAFVGSDEKMLRNSLKDNLANRKNAQSSMKATIENNLIKVVFETSYLGNNYRVNVALVQKNGFSKVQRGENRGLSLSHVQIVKELAVKPSLTTSSLLTLNFEAGSKSEDFELIGFVQDNKTGEIIAATRQNL